MNTSIVKTFEPMQRVKINSMIYITCRHLPGSVGSTPPSQLVKLPPKSFIYIFNISKSSKLPREKDILSFLFTWHTWIY